MSCSQLLCLQESNIFTLSGRTLRDRLAFYKLTSRAEAEQASLQGANIGSVVLLGGLCRELGEGLHSSSSQCLEHRDASRLWPREPSCKAAFSGDPTPCPPGGCSDPLPGMGCLGQATCGGSSKALTSVPFFLPKCNLIQREAVIQPHFSRKPLLVLCPTFYEENSVSALAGKSQNHEWLKQQNRITIKCHIR